MRETDTTDYLVAERRNIGRVGFSTRDVAPAVDLGASAERYAGGMILAALTLAAGVNASSAESRCQTYMVEHEMNG